MCCKLKNSVTVKTFTARKDNLLRCLHVCSHVCKACTYSTQASVDFCETTLTFVLPCISSCLVLPGALLMDQFIKSSLKLLFALICNQIPSITSVYVHAREPSPHCQLQESTLLAGWASLVGNHTILYHRESQVCLFFMSPHQDIQCGIAHSCSCHTSVPPPMKQMRD